MELKDSLWILFRIKDKKKNIKLTQCLGCFKRYIYAEMYADRCDLDKDEFVIEQIPYLEPIEKPY